MPSTTTLNETTRATLDGTESVRLATTGANWKTTTQSMAQKFINAVNVLDFGADPTGAADSTSAVQSAIDYAYNNNFRRVVVPVGTYKISKPIYLDDPNNFRALNPPNAYNSGQTYYNGSVATYGGLAYVSFTGTRGSYNSGAQSGHEPDISPTYWKLLVYNAATAYNVGDYVTYNGIAWACLVANTGQAPVLPAKLVSGTTYTAGQIVEYRGQYWQVKPGQTGSNGNLQWGALNTTIWASYPIYWLPWGIRGEGSYANIAQSPDLEGTAPDAQTGYRIPTFNFTYNCAVGLLVGPGQGSTVRGLIFNGAQGLGDAFSYDGSQPGNGTAIGLTGEGGATRAFIQNCQIQNWYYGITTGYTGDAVGDSNRFSEINMSNMGLGIWISETQNYINSAFNCNIGALWAVLCTSGGGMNIFGGNYSHVPSGTTSQYYAISAISSTLNSSTQQMTATLGSPDIWMAAGAFNMYCVLTPNYGIVPLTLSSYTESTGVAVFNLYAPWVAAVLDSYNSTVCSDLAADLATVTGLYAAKTSTTFQGSGLRVFGAYVEQTNFTPTTVVDSATWFAGDRPNWFNIFVQYDPTANGYGGYADGTAQKAMYYISSILPFINAISAVSTTFETCLLAEPGGPIPLQIYGDQHVTSKGAPLPRLKFRNCSPALNAAGGGACAANGTYGKTGNWDNIPIQINGTLASDNGYPEFLGVDEWENNAPSRTRIPYVYTDYLARLFAPLPNPVTALRYPLLHGGTTYRVVPSSQGGPTITGETTFPMVRSNHAWYTWGYDLTISWSYKAGSRVLFVSTLNQLFVGLIVMLMSHADVVGGGANIPWSYRITGLYPNATTSTYPYYVTVVGEQNADLPGVASTIYTGTTLMQQKFALETLGGSSKNAQLPSPPLDLVTANVVAAYGFRKLRTAYAGSAVNVRRSSDNTAQDIGFVNNEFDIATFNTFVGSGTGYITKWYDQSGSGFDVSQATTTLQPQVVINGLNGLPSAMYDNTGNMTLTRTGITNPNYTAGTIEIVAQAFMLSSGGPVSSGSWVVNMPNTSGNYTWQLGVSNNLWSTTGTSSTFAIWMLPVQAAAAFTNRADCYLRVNDTIGHYGGQYLASAMSIGGFTEIDIGQHWYGYISEVIVASIDMSLGSDRALGGNQRQYWGL